MRLGIVGTGFAEQHLQWIAAVPQLRAAALCYQHGVARAQALAHAYGVPVCSGHADEVVATGELDGVVIVSPPDTHEALVAAALARDLVVVCDKPIAASLEAARRIVALDAAHGRKGRVMFQWRVHRAMQDARAAIEAGAIGAVAHLSLSFRHDFLAGIETPTPWRHDMRRCGAGALGDMGVHLFDLVRYLAPAAWTVSAASGGIARSRRTHDGRTIDCDAEDFADVALEADTGARASVAVSRICRGLREIRIVVSGLDGAIDLRMSPEDTSASLRIHRDGAPPSLTDYPAGALNPYRHLDGVADAPGALATFEDGLFAQELLSMAVARIRAAASSEAIAV